MQISLHLNAPRVSRGLDHDTDALAERPQRGIDLSNPALVKWISKTSHRLFIGAEPSRQCQIRDPGCEHGVVQRIQKGKGRGQASDFSRVEIGGGNGGIERNRELAGGDVLGLGPLLSSVVLLKS